jgi:hypothetical protein
MRSSYHHDSSAIAQILNPTNGYRGQLEKKGIKPKNHISENRAALKKKEAEIKERQEAMNLTTSKWRKIIDNLRRTLCPEQVQKCRKPTLLTFLETADCQILLSCLVAIIRGQTTDCPWS